MLTVSQKLSFVGKVVSRRRKIHFVFTLISIFTNAIFEIVSLAAVVPFLSVLSSPQIFMESSAARKYAPHLGITDAMQAVTLVCITFAVLTVVSATVRTVTIIVNSKFTLALGADLSRIVFERTLYQPYSSHAMQNSAAVIANVTQNVNAFVNGIMSPSIQFLTSTLTVVGILVTLFLINWWVALTASIVFGGAYLGISRLNRSRYARNSSIVVSAQDEVVKALQEGLGGIRDVIIDGNQQFYTRIYI
jgi:ATP-binding cassette subfamily B protein